MGRHGQGWISRDGRRVAVTMADGRRVWRRADGLRDAKRIRRALVEAREAEVDPSRLTLADYLRSWLRSLRDAKRSRIRPRTLDHYTLIVEQHIIPALGKVRLGSLSERNVQAWLDADAGSAQTIHHHRAVLRRALNVAVRQRLIGRNVALAVELPDVPAFRPAPLTVAECRALFGVESRLAALWRLAADTGLRQAELLGLGWDDVDLEAGCVTVSAQLQRHDGGWIRTPPKAARSSERVYLTPGTVTALVEHQRKQAAERTAEWRYFGLVFVTGTGEPYHGSEVLKAFKAACRAAGIAERRFHDLRSTADTLMAEAGVPEHVRMARLGHSTVTMARHYTVVRDQLDRDAADQLARVLPN